VVYAIPTQILCDPVCDLPFHCLWKGTRFKATGEAWRFGNNERKVSEIDFEYSASSVLCMRHRIVLRPDNAEIFTERCRNASRTDRTTFCEVKEGRISQEDFAKLAQLLEQNSFFTMQSEYWGDVTDAVFESTRAKRDGETHEVINYADAGPLRLWTIQRAIEGAALNVDWQMATTRPKCPHWNDRVTKRP